MDNDFGTLLMHDYALIDYFRMFKNSYHLIMTGQSVDSIYKMSSEDNSLDISFTLYYQKLYYFSCLVSKYF